MELMQTHNPWLPWLSWLVDLGVGTDHGHSHTPSSSLKKLGRHLPDEIIIEPIPVCFLTGIEESLLLEDKCCSEPTST
eukprot:gene26018-biopygen13010